MIKKAQNTKNPALWERAVGKLQKLGGQRSCGIKKDGTTKNAGRLLLSRCISVGGRKGTRRSRIKSHRKKERGGAGVFVTTVSAALPAGHL